LSCALTLGSAYKKPYALNKKIGIFMHQSESGANNALLNNVLGISPNTKGVDVLINGKKHLSDLYPHIIQLSDNKVVKIEEGKNLITVVSETKTYYSKLIVIAVTPSSNFSIEGLEQYVEPHKKMPEVKKRIQLRNIDHLVTDGIFVAGILAGHRSQYLIASGSGTEVATDILTEWNEGNHAMVHDVLPSEK
jgi:hypothetical protein